MTRLHTEKLLMQGRSLLRQAKCPQCECRGLMEINRKCPWCVERAAHMDAVLDHKSDEQESTGKQA